jgi:nicotinate-nucleotide adenylyltransferase
LGGSFNPAHEGHAHISLHALRALRLDEIWWLVSPQNPLKARRGMASYAARLEGARRLAPTRTIVSDIEAKLGTRYTVDTLAALQRSFPSLRFVWLMGADNLIQLPRWKNWTRIFVLVPIAVFDRAPYSFTALSGPAARRFAKSRRTERDAGRLAELKPPAWIYFRTPLHPASATALRARNKRR